MNIDTGQISRLTEQDFAAMPDVSRLIAIEEELMTAKQRANLQVNLHDTRSELGKLRHAVRSKYTPHLGAKELAKLEFDSLHVIPRPERAL